jgi:uncharacterized protein YaiL (DUF2058 family)
LENRNVAGSLKDQLLKAGLASRKQAKDAELAKRREQKQNRSGPDSAEQERAAAIEAARREKIAKDRELNEQRQAEKDRRALRAEIRQLAEQHRVAPSPNADLRYHFVRDGRVQSIWVDAELQKQLGAGTLSLVAVEQAFVLVPADIAARIAQRDPAALIQNEEHSRARDAADDALYDQFPIPDDLHW